MGSRGRILCIEDDAEIRQLVTEILESDGYDVLAVPTVLDALGATVKADPDLVLLDLKLPGLDGTAFFRQHLSAGATRARIIVMTATDRLGEIPPHVDAVIRKPFDIDELTSTIEDVLARPAAPQPT